MQLNQLSYNYRNYNFQNNHNLESDSKSTLIQRFKNGNKIKIKKKNVGSFTKYCDGKVTNECIQKGKNSPNASIRKKAIFAQNSRKWKHE